jgi:hypothetical protein
MDDKSTKRGGAALTLALVIVLAMLPFFYVLSIGPVARMFEDGRIPRSWEPSLEVIYFPVTWAAENVPAAAYTMTGYMNLWMPPNQAVSAVPPPNAVPPPIAPTAPAIQPTPPSTAKPSAHEKAPPE